jgi:hypothetical protein
MLDGLSRTTETFIRQVKRFALIMNERAKQLRNFFMIATEISHGAAKTSSKQRSSDQSTPSTFRRTRLDLIHPESGTLANRSEMLHGTESDLHMMRADDAIRLAHVAASVA